MESSLLLLLLSCPWPVGCSRTPPSHPLDREPPYRSQEREQPYDSLEERPPTHALTSTDTLKRSQPKKMRSPKSEEDIGCVPSNGTTAYTGKANTTESGRTCQIWSLNTPHEHRFNDVGEHNYCRDPIGLGLVCITTDPQKYWEYCDVPLCVYYTKGKQMHTNTT